MLQTLRVSNYAIIDQLEINFSGNLTIITGETGAGKSILIGALSLILGARADLSVLYDKNKKCIVEGAFDIANYDLGTFFENEMLDFEPVTLIRREINPAGKSRAFINDTPVTLDTLKNLTNQLVDIHQQHETTNLAGTDFQLMVIDSVAANQNHLKKYRDIFEQYQQLISELKALEQASNEALREKDYLQFQHNELEAAGLVESDEQEILEEEYSKLSHAEAIKSSLTRSSQLLQDGEINTIGLLSEVRQALQIIVPFSNQFAELHERLESARIELQDIAQTINQIDEEILYNDARIEEINDRLNQLYRLQKKHGANSVSELLAIQNALSNKLADFSNLDTEIAKLMEEIVLAKTAVELEANKLSSRRKNVLPAFEQKINEMLPDVGLPKSKLVARQQVGEIHAANKSGIDRINFLFSANPGSEPIEIKKVASGGELSRLMLIIKSLVAATTALPTMIFDEIDSGISGEVGIQVGNILQSLGKSHQVVCITHLPQIAGKGNTHYYIYKEVKNDHTYTMVKKLDGHERIVEIAKMISGDKPSEAALENARELLMN